MKSVHISVSAKGTMEKSDKEIVIGFYGPKGGTRSIQSFTLAQAYDLHRTLGKAIWQLETLT